MRSPLQVFKDSSYFSRNYNAAFADYLELLKRQGIEPGKVGEIRPFQISFELSYKTHRRDLDEKERFAKRKDDKHFFSENVGKTLDTAISFLEDYVSSKRLELLASSFGTLMAALQYGLTSGYFLSNEEVNKYSEYSTKTLKQIEYFMEHIWKVNRKIKCANIAARVLQISKERKDNLKYNNYQFLVNDISHMLATSH